MRPPCSFALCQTDSQDLVIHPPDPNNPTPIPLYTLVRTSATATTPDWYQSNVPPPTDPSADPRPQWVRTIAQKLEVLVPLDMHLTRAYDDSGSEGSGSDDEDDDGDLDLDGDLDSLGDDDNIVTVAGTDEATVLETPEIHPHRFRLYGITLSPGGGVAAVLASSHSTQHPERGGWHTVRSSVLFAHKPRRPRHSHHQPPDPSLMAIDPQFNPQPPPPIPNLTTEARLFENLYGHGSPIPGIHTPPSSSPSPLSEIFTPLLTSQTCDLCNAPIDIRKGSLAGCRNGHFFGTCATSGLAVQTPGATRSCGACGLRTMRAGLLVGRVPAEQGWRREEVRRAVAGGVCGACGGKFLS